MTRISKAAGALAFLALCAVCTTSCVTAQGSPTRGKIPARIEIRPDTNNKTNRLNTQHVFVAKVTDAQGRPVPEARVEWILQRHMCQVGDIVDVGDACSPCAAAKRDNTYAVGETARRPHTLPNGTRIDIGESYLVVTSSFPGATNVIAYAPGIENWNQHKVFGVKYWGPDYDYGCDTTPGCAPGSSGTATVWVQKDGGSASTYRVDFVGEGVNVSPSSCTIGPMTPNSMERASCNVSVSANAAGSYRISYTITPGGAGGNDDNCCCPGATEPNHEGYCMIDFGAGELVCQVNPLTPSLCPGDPASFEVVVTNTGSCEIPSATINANFTGCCNCPAQSMQTGMLAPGQSYRQNIQCAATQNCSQGSTCAVNVTVSAGGVRDTTCQASVSFGTPSLVCTLSPRQSSLCPGDDAVFALCIRNTGNCDAVGVQPQMTFTHNGAPLNIMASGNCAFPQTIPAGGEYCCDIVLPGNSLPQSGRVCADVSVPGTSANCNACVELGTISVVCDKRLTNGDAQGRLEVGDMANFAVTIRNTSSCGVTINSVRDNPTCGTVNDSDCQRLVGQMIPAGGTVSCNVSVDTQNCQTGSFENVFSVDVGAGPATASTECRAPFVLFVIPAMECSFQDLLDPVYVSGTPRGANKSSTTTLEWRYTNQRHTVEGAVFRWEIPSNLKFEKPDPASNVDLSGAPHFDASQLRFSNTSRGGINYQVIEIPASRNIEEGDDGVINISVQASNAGLATTKGFWRFRGYEEWVQEDCGTTVRP